MVEKKIKIFTGDTNLLNLFEKGLHPENQIKLVKDFLKSSPDIFSIITNSPFVAESFNRFGKEKGYKIECYFSDEMVLPEVMFEKFSKPFGTLIFGGEE